jgi:DNA-binding transcriptional MerR regulator
LKPSRTNAGYRTYTERDLERLEQSMALKFLGFPLKQIKGVIDRAALELPDALRAQRRGIEEQHARLERAIRAIRAAEAVLEAGTSASPTVLKSIIEAIDIQDGIDAMRKYYSEEAWERRRRYYEQGPSPEWQALYRDVGALLGKDSASEEAQAVASRWLELSVKAYAGDPDVQTDSPTAWMDREHWPPAMKRRIAEFNLVEVTEFIKAASLCSRKKYFSEAAWAKVVELRTQSDEAFSRAWQARVDLFRDVEAALGEDPAGEKAKALAVRWMAQIEAASGGDRDVKAGLMKTWADRRHWPATLRWQTEGLYMMPFERFERAADFIDEAVGIY